MNHNETLKETLIAISNNVHSYYHTKELVRITRRLVKRFLKDNKSDAVRFAAYNGIDLNDLVDDSIIEMFGKDDSGRLFTINRFINALDQSVEEINSKKLFLAYFSFTVKLVSIQIARLYAEHDPNGAAIYKNIKGTVKKMDLFEVHKTKRITIFSIKNCSEYSSKNYIDYDTFLKKFLSEAQDRKNTRELLIIIHGLLYDQTDYRKEINIIDVVKLFKAYYSYEERVLEEDDSSLNHTDFSILDETEIKHLISKVIDDIKRKILTDYFGKQKLNKEQALGLADTINEILYDWINVGKDGLSNYEYLNKFLSVSTEEYNTTFKAKLEYLIKLSKEKLKFYLENG